MDIDSFFTYFKSEDFYKDIANDVKNGLTHLTMTKMITDHFQKVKTRKSLVYLRMN